MATLDDTVEKWGRLFLKSYTRKKGSIPSYQQLRSYVTDLMDGIRDRIGTGYQFPSSPRRMIVPLMYGNADIAYAGFSSYERLLPTNRIAAFRSRHLPYRS